jgi:hypothetical protein
MHPANPCARPPSTSTSLSRRRPSSTGADDAVSLLVADHRDLDVLFLQYATLARSGADAGERQWLAARIRARLALHLVLEEEIFYPEARNALGAAGAALLDEAALDHAAARHLMRRIEETRAGSERHDALVAMLGAHLRHHADEEERGLFPRVERSSMDLVDAGSRMAARRTEWMASNARDLDLLQGTLPR